MSNQKETENMQEQCAPDEFIVLTMDDGTERTFKYEDNFEFKGKRYLCISPTEEMDGIAQDELLIYELVSQEDGDASLNPLENEDLLNEVYDEYCRRFQEESDECDCCDVYCCDGHCGCDKTDECDTCCKEEGECDCEQCPEQQPKCDCGCEDCKH